MKEGRCCGKGQTIVKFPADYQLGGIAHPVDQIGIEIAREFQRIDECRSEQGQAEGNIFSLPYTAEAVWL